jgi:hypothetical protein
MTLQQEFTRAVADLIVWAYNQGFTLTVGEAWRTPAQAHANAAAGTGIVNSLHRERLAIDLNLFRAGKWLDRSEDHAPLGAYWKTLHKAARWGGDFKSRPDGNHYSFSPDGRRA